MTQSPPRSEATFDASGPFRIQMAAELAGVPAATLRAWERRYRVPIPRRSAASYRLYTAEDVELIRGMRELVAQGVSPADAAKRVLAAGSPLSARSGDLELDGLALARARILGATQRWDSEGIDREIGRLWMLLDAQTLFERVVSPLLTEVGERWERGELSIAQEHLLSERLELAIRADLRSLERADGPRVLLACVDGEQHVLGLLGASLRFASSGARTVVLGATTPPSALREAVGSMAPRLVGLSVAVTPPHARSLFRAYGKACGITPWVVGGRVAESVRAAVESAGGTVASGSSSEWSAQIREWLRSRRP